MRIDTETKKMLESYSESTQRSQSNIASRVLREYLREQKKRDEMIQEALDDIKHGRVVSQEETEKWLQSYIDGKPSKVPQS